MNHEDGPEFLLGQRLMMDLTGQLNALGAGMRSLEPMPGDPGAVHRGKVALLDHGLATIEETEQKAVALNQGPLPASVTETFDELRRGLMDAQQAVRAQLAQIVAGTY